MRLCILGPTGNSGRRIVSEAVARGHQVTALVRTAGALAATPNLNVGQMDFSDVGALENALRAHDVVINAAGYVADGSRFTDLVGRIINATASALGPGGRFWLFGGAALLDVPGAKGMGIDLPGVPKMYEAHRTNYNAIRASGLDWSMLCPGPMVDAPDGKATHRLVISENSWPVPRPALTYALPRLATSLAFKQAMPRMTIYYEDAAKVILDHLETNGRFSRKRVGVALPDGERRHKTSP
ncbi:MAG: NAD(P)H-binding protein [Terricaulis sp.]